MRTKLLDGQTSADPRFRVTTGTVIGHYEVLRPVGAGGMAQVYLARDLELGRRVALKVIDARSMSAPGSEDFAREARTLAQFNHPNIITVFGAGTFVDSPYIAMEFVEGETLRARLESDVLAAREAQRLVLGVASGLEEAHRHDVIHGDLKPENVVISRDGRVRILDFGLARLFQTGTTDGTRLAPRDALRGELKNVERSSSNESSMRGTPDYMAPEQWRGEERTPAIDVWAFGVMLFEVFARRRPLQEASMLALCDRVASDEPLPSIRSFCDLPAPLAELIDRCVDKRADKRPSASECAAVLSRLVHGVVLERAEGDDAPFRGLSAFTEQHAAFFFGRDDDIAACIERLRDEPVLPIVGASGVGKSSFIQAGVIPRLREQGEWSVLRIRPGADPFRALASRLAMSKSAKRIRMALKQTGETPEDHAGGEVDPLVLARELYDSPKRLALMLRAEAKVQNGRVLLLVDQLEEACTLVADRETRMRFFAAVCSAADDPLEPVRVVFTVRDDFLSRLAESPEARAALAHVMVLRAPGDDALVDILEKPPHAVGYRYDDPTLVADMIAAVKGELSALPLLQFCGSMLWDRRNTQARTLGRAAYQAIGGVQGALATHADSFMRELSETQAKLVRAVLLRLVTPEGTRRITAKKALLEALGPAVEPVLLSLTTSRLVSVREVFDEVHYELSHESLVQTWERLRTWLEEGREELVFLAEIEQASTLWDKRGRRVSEVWTGAPLKDALRRIERYQCKLTVVGEAFIASCVRAEQRRVFARRAVAIGGVAVLASIAIVSAITAVRFGEKTRIAVQERAAAQAEGARSAFLRGDFIAARAQLRSSFAQADSALVRSLFADLAAQPIEWKRELPAPLQDLAVSPDGRELAAAAVDQSVYLIDRDTGALSTLREHAEQVLGVAYSDDGRWLASSDMSGAIVLRDRRGGASRTIAAAPSWKLAFSHDGRYLASAGLDGRARVWTSADGALVRAWTFDGRLVRVVFGRSSDLLVVGTRSGGVALIDLNEDAPLATLSGGHTAPIFSLAFTDDDARLASGSEEGTVALWDVKTRQLVRRWKAGESAVTSLAFAGDELYAASYEPALQVWDAATGTLKRTLTQHASGVVGVVVGADGHVFSAGQSDRRVIAWNVGARASTAHNVGHGALAEAAVFSPDGSQIVSAGDDGAVRRWDVSSGRQISVHTEATDAVLTVAANADVFVSGSVDRRIRVYDAHPGKLSFALDGHKNGVYGVALAGDRLYSASYDGTVRAWSLSQRRQIAEISVGAPIVTASFGARIGAFATESAGHFVVNLDPLRLIEKRVGEGWGLAVAPDDSRYVLATVRGELVTIARDGARAAPVQASAAALYRGAFDPSGARVGFGAHATPAIWRVGEASPVVELRGHVGDVQSVSFDAKGERAVTVGDDATVRVWRTSDGAPLWRTRAVLRHTGEILTHRGWERLGGAAFAPRPIHARLADAVDADADATIGCALYAGGTLALWKDEASVTEANVANATSTRANAGACEVLLSDGSARRVDARGVITLAAAPVSVELRGEDFVARGFANGAVEVYDAATGARRAIDFQDPLRGAVVAMALAPRGTLLVASASGVVGLWSLRGGARLASAKLHGPARWLVPRDGAYDAVSVLGDVATFDLRMLQETYCGARKHIDQAVRVVWRDGVVAYEASSTPCEAP